MISLYETVKEKTATDITLLSFLDDIRNGKWEDSAYFIRTIEDKKLRSQEKQLLPAVTISGSFSERKIAGLRKHSGVIAIDLDNLENPQGTKKLLKKDPYVYAAFVSVSGAGLCVLFKIDGERHLDAFNAIAAYLYANYQLIVDQSGKDVSRARFVSYDPDILIKDDAVLFKKYLPKTKNIKKPEKIVFVKTDFDQLINEMIARNVNICEDYSGWLSTCYSLVSKFGESGRDYFHMLSKMSSKYNAKDVDKQYDTCIKSHSESKSRNATIATIYSHAAKDEDKWGVLAISACNH